MCDPIPCSEMHYIDSHCHLAASEFTPDLHEVIQHAKDVGVKACIVVAENQAEFKQVIKIYEQYAGFSFPCLGVHPVQEQRSVTLDEVHAALPLLHQYSSQLVGIGEVGLDFTPHLCATEEHREIQKEALRLQVQVASQYDLPLNIHSRSAAKETVRLLKEAGAHKVLLHNFAGRVSVAMEAVSQGYYLSFPPRVAVKPERNKLLQQMPLDCLCLETDSPALGLDAKTRNEPSQIVTVCEHIAKLRNVDVGTVAQHAHTNTCKLFNKLGFD